MTLRAFLLFVLAVVGGGYAIVTNWDDIAAALHIGKMPEEDAIRLAKEYRSLEAQRTNAQVIRDAMTRDDAKMEELGWRAEQHGDLFLVRFDYRQDGEPRTFAFEVHLGNDAVRNVIGDPSLEQKYAIANPDD